MKKIIPLAVLVVSLGFLPGCDKGFEDINENPQAVNSVDPGFLFTNAQRSLQGGNWAGESTLAQQFVLPYILGNTQGPQFNDNVDGINAGRWNTYTGSLKHLEHIIAQIKDDPTRVNLYNQSRILRAYNYMTLVDTYGDVPYKEAGKAFLESIFYPKYDKDDDIYADLYKEIREATLALSPTGENNSRFDIFFTSGTTANYILPWKRFGYSLMLRLGMRYSKADATKAKSIVQEAFNGGVMTSNSDNILVRNMTATKGPVAGYVNALNTGIRANNPYFYYLTEPLINRLKLNGDPRTRFISARYAPLQSSAPSVLSPDTTLANQFGFPIGYSDVNLSTYPGFRPASGTGQNYSQLNFNVVGSDLAPIVIITNAQTKLLLAEAAFRGWLSGLSGAKTAQEYYEEGVRASIDGYNDFPNTTPTPLSVQNQYLANANIAYNATNALQLINTQYWIESFNNGLEAWTNFRRSGFPTLSPNLYNNSLNGGFIRRLPYPLRENTGNTENYNAGVASLGGPDNYLTRIFWDTP